MKDLFAALIEDKDLEKSLDMYIFFRDYKFGTEGGEPDLAYMLALRLLEKVKGKRVQHSIVYSRAYLEHIGEVNPAISIDNLQELKASAAGLFVVK